MLALDTAAQERSAKMLRNEVAQAEFESWVHDQTEMSKYVDDPDLNPLASARKIGKPMGYLELERRLGKLNKNLRFVWGPFNKNFKKLYLDVPSDQATVVPALPGALKLFDDSKLKDLGIVYPVGGVMPERSIWKSSIEYYPDPSYKPKYNDGVNPRDWVQVPRSDEETAALFAQAGIACEIREGSEMPPKNHPYAWLYYKWIRVNPDTKGDGWIRKVVPLGEQTRGWRTVLLKLVESQILTPAAVEKEFLNDNTQEWRSHMGFGAQVLPW